MTARDAGRHALRPLLELDPQLAESVPAEHRARALATVTASTRRLARGGWDAIAEYGGRREWLGLLVIEGFLARRTTCGPDTVGEIVGPGDLLRPWDHDGDYPIEGIGTTWQLLEPTLLALLDESFATSVAPWPSLTAAVLARIGRRARWLGLRLLISQVPGVSLRVFYLLWHLAERWGRPEDDALLVPIRLTHEHIAELVGAQRPSVSNAIGRLRAEGVERIPGVGWRIPLEAPALIEAMLSARGGERERA